MKVYNDIDINNDILSKFPSFYQNIFMKWINNYTSKPTFSFMIFSELINLNSNIKIDTKPVHFPFFSDKILNFIGQLFSDNENIKPRKNMTIEFHFKDTHKIYCLHIIDALLKTWKGIALKETQKILLFFDHHIVRKCLIHSPVRSYSCWHKCC